MSRPKRATAQQPKNYSEQDIGDTPLVSTIRWPLKLPGLLKISNACFANEASNVRRAAQDGLVVVVTEGEHERAKNGLYGGANVAYFPFRDEINEPEAVVRRQIRRAVGAVRAHWKRKPGTAVLVPGRVVSYLKAPYSRKVSFVFDFLKFFRIRNQLD